MMQRDWLDLISDVIQLVNLNQHNKMYNKPRQCTDCANDMVVLAST